MSNLNPKFTGKDAPQGRAPQDFMLMLSYVTPLFTQGIEAEKFQQSKEYCHWELNEEKFLQCNNFSSIFLLLNKFWCYDNTEIVGNLIHICELTGAEPIYNKWKHKMALTNGYNLTKSQIAASSDSCKLQEIAAIVNQPFNMITNKQFELCKEIILEFLDYKDYNCPFIAELFSLKDSNDNS